jgi:hypothetical protein
VTRINYGPIHSFYRRDIRYYIDVSDGPIVDDKITGFEIFFSGEIRMCDAVFAGYTIAGNNRTYTGGILWHS